MRVRAAETPKYATKQISSEDTIPMGMALWGFFTSSPGGAQRVERHSYSDQNLQTNHLVYLKNAENPRKY